MNKKNILILSTSSYGGGTERLLIDQLEEYSKNKNIKKKVNLYCITLRKGDLENEFMTYSNYFSLDLERRMDFSGLKRLISFIDEKKITILSANLIEGWFYGVLIKILRPKIKLFGVQHNTNKFIKNPFWGILLNFFSLFSAKVVCVSNSVKKFMRKYCWISNKKLCVIYNAIDVKKFKKGKKMRKHFGIGKNDFAIGVVGRLIEQKGHIYLIKAISNLIKKIPNINLFFAGIGELEEELKKEIKSMNLTNRVKFLGFVNDPYNFYKSIDIFCLPSIFEGFGLVIVEAMASGTPVIISDIDGPSELIEDNVSGLKFKSKNYKELSKRIAVIYTDKRLRNKIVTKALKVSENFGIEGNINHYVTLFNKEND